MKNLLITFFLLFLLACAEEQPTPLQKSILTEQEQSLAGEWVGTNWYCNNTNNCVVNPLDVNAVLKFSVTLEGEEITLSPGKWTKPSCVAPTCGVNDWIVSSITLSGEELTIMWKHGYSFKGVKQDSKFLGNITYTYSAGSYIWNNNVELIKKE